MDVEAALRAGLEQAYGPGHDYATHRFTEDGGVTVEVNLLRDGRPSAGNDQQTGHAAIATLLETSLDIATPAPELADRALRCGDRHNADWTEAAAAVALRGDEETYRVASLWRESADPLRRALGADVLALLT
jgi:hypothetical protein